jgi:hypothetical protein
MSTKAGVGVSHHRHFKTAAREAVEGALAKAGIAKPDFVLMYASVAYPQQPLVAAVRDLTQGASLIGCSGSGLIGPGEAEQGSFYVGVMAIASDEIRFDTAMAGDVKSNPSASGIKIGGALRSKVGDDALCLITLADGLTFNFDKFRAGLEGAMRLKASLPMVGGAAGDDLRMKQTYQYCDDAAISDGVVCALMSGSARVATAVNHGCIPLGEARTITRAVGNLIYEIDGVPVLTALKEYLAPDEIDNWDRAVINLSLGFKTPGTMEGYDEYLIRMIPAKDDQAGSITIPTEVTSGTQVWMTRRDKDKISEGVRKIAASVKEQLAGDRPKFILHFDCVGRGGMMFREQEKRQLLVELQEQIDREAPWLGFYTYGEIGPVGKLDCFHNYTLVLAAIH